MLRHRQRKGALLCALLALWAVPAAGAQAGDPLSWRFPPASPPVLHSVEVGQKEARGAERSRCDLRFTLRSELLSVDEAGAAVWRLRVTGLEASVQDARGTQRWTSRKPDAFFRSAYLSECKTFRGPPLRVTVAPDGRITALKGFLPRLSRPGSLEVVAADAEAETARGLFEEALHLLFRLPRKAVRKKRGGGEEEGSRKETVEGRALCFGTAIVTGRTGWRFNLSAEQKPRPAAPRRLEGLDGVQVSWTSELLAEAWEVKSRDTDFRVERGRAGKGRGSGTYALEAGVTLAVNASRSFALEMLRSGAPELHAFSRTVRIDFEGYEEE